MTREEVIILRLTDLAPFILGTLSSILLFFIMMPMVEALWVRENHVAFRKRLNSREGIARYPGWGQKMRSRLNIIKRIVNPFFCSWPGRFIFNLWQDAGFGSEPLVLMLLMIGIFCSGGFAGYFLTGSLLLTGFLVMVLELGLLVMLYYRARSQRHLFQDQFPDVLDRLADSLQAGFSLPQAINFIASNLSEPSASEMSLISTQIQLGFSVDESLRSLYQRRTNEDIRLLVEGLGLQRQVGGNMAVMMRDLSLMVRKRVELKNEVRTLTAQGRDSAIVIALLVPASLGLLSMFPGYIEVLYQTTIGNLVLIASGCLEIIGAVIIMRLIRIEW